MHGKLPFWYLEEGPKMIRDMKNKYLSSWNYQSNPQNDVNIYERLKFPALANRGSNSGPAEPLLDLNGGVH